MGVLLGRESEGFEDEVLRLVVDDDDDDGLVVAKGGLRNRGSMSIEQRLGTRPMTSKSIEYMRSIHSVDTFSRGNSGGGAPNDAQIE